MVRMKEEGKDFCAWQPGDRPKTIARRRFGRGQSTLLALTLVVALGTLYLKVQQVYSGWRLSGFSFNAGYTCQSASGCQGDGLRAQASEFDWSSITPSEKLVWTPCHAGFQCARFSVRVLVPLDYSAPGGEKAAVALVKYPSKIPPGEAGYRGPVLFNPGGPGGSGVQMVLSAAEDFRTILGDEYDLIGFDPRGVGHTTPALSVFPSTPEAAYLFDRAERAANASEESLGQLYASLQLVGDIARDRLKDVGEHVATPAVARDMLRIVQAHGMDKLQYWGFSYGTVLGATFAAMFPDNVGRLVLDGVVDSEDYYGGLWSNNLRDTDAGLFQIYQACVDAGPSVCPIYESSVSEINARVNNLLEKLRIQPLYFYNTSTGAYGTLDYSAAKTSIFSVLYDTHHAGARLSHALAEAERGAGQPLYDVSARAVQSAALQCNSTGAPLNLPAAIRYESTLAVACGDAGSVGATLEEMREYYEEMGRSSVFAEVWWMRIACVGWKITTKERMKAKFEANTSFPLLLIGNTADPVTPHWNALKMSKGFTNSVVLTQDSPGHCSVAAVSACTVKAIRDYFRDGKLPAEGTVCSVQSSIFGSGANTFEAMAELSAEDAEMLKASEMLGRKYFVPKM